MHGCLCEWERDLALLLPHLQRKHWQLSTGGSSLPLLLRLSPHLFWPPSSPHTFPILRSLSRPPFIPSCSTHTGPISPRAHRSPLSCFHISLFPSFFRLALCSPFSSSSLQKIFFFFMPSNFFEPRLQLYVCLNSDGVLSGQIVVPVFVCQTNNYCVISRTLPFSDDPEQSVFACCRWRFSSAARETRPCVHLFMPAHREGSPCIFMNNRHILWIHCEASLCLMAPSHSSLVYRFAWHVIYLHRHPDGDVTWYFSSLRVLISELLTYYWNRKCMTFWPLNSSKTILSAQMRKKNTCTITAIREYIYIYILYFHTDCLPYSLLVYRMIWQVEKYNSGTVLYCWCFHIVHSYTHC